MKKTRELYLDLLRVTACFAVILIHTKGHGATLFLKYDPGTWGYYSALFFTVFIRFAVPVFFAVSGATLLGRKEESPRKMFSRIIRIVIVLLIFSLLHYLDDVVPAEGAFRPLRFLALTYSRNIHATLWYLYAYLAFLVSLPVLRPLAQNLSDAGFRYMFLLILAVGSLIPCLEVCLLHAGYRMNTSFDITWMLSDVVAYPMLGYYFHDRLDPKRDLKDLWWVWPLTAAALLFTTFTLGRMMEISGGYSKNIFRIYVAKFDLLHTFSLFLLARCLCTRVHFPGWLQKAVFGLAPCVFGIYLIHVFFMKDGRLFEKCQSFLTSSGHIGELAATLLAALLIMAVSGLITWILRRIPAVRRFL